MFFHIFNNYLKFIDVDFPIIELYLQYEQNIDTLKMLINNNYLVTKKSIIESLDFEEKNTIPISIKNPISIKDSKLGGKSKKRKHKLRINNLHITRKIKKNYL